MFKYLVIWLDLAKKRFPLKFSGNLFEHINLTNQGNKKGGICDKKPQIPPLILGVGSSNPYQHPWISFFLHLIFGHKKTLEALRF